MKSYNYILLALIALMVTTTSCEDRKTYADYLKAEIKAIDKFINQNDFVILKEFPTDGKFKDKEFYRDPATGVYYNIIEVGDTAGVYKLKIGDEINIRYSGLRYFSNSKDTMQYENMDPIRSPWPETFQYKGVVNLETKYNYNGTTSGWFVPLKYVGHNGKVKMIIPFTWGSQSDMSSFKPTYYNLVKYNWYN